MPMKIKRDPTLKRNNAGQQRAQGIVEFAMVLPVLLLLVFGIIEFGRLMFIYASVASASREAVRYGAAIDDTSGIPRYADCTGIRAAGRRIGKFAGVSDADIAIRYDDGVVGVAASCVGITDVEEIELGDRIVVTVNANYAPMILWDNINPFPITSTSARTIIKRVKIEGTPAPTPTPLPACNFEFTNFSILTDGKTVEWIVVNNGTEATDTDSINKIDIDWKNTPPTNGDLVKIFDGPEIWSGVAPNPLIINDPSFDPAGPRLFTFGSTKKLQFRFWNPVMTNQSNYGLKLGFEYCRDEEAPTSLPAP